jgi:hypothetical protein
VKYLLKVETQIFRHRSAADFLGAIRHYASRREQNARAPCISHRAMTYRLSALFNLKAAVPGWDEASAWAQISVLASAWELLLA